MKTKISRIMSFVLSLCLIIGTFIPLNTMTVSAESATDNLLYGLTPVEFYRVASGTDLNAIDWGGVQVDSYGAKLHGYSSRLGYSSSGDNAILIPYLNRFTDDSFDGGTRFNFKQATHIITYQLNTRSTLDRIDLNFASGGGNNTSARIRVYASDTLNNAMFTASPLFDQDFLNTKSASIDLNVDASYIAIAIEHATTINQDLGIDIKNIKLVGAEHKNILAGLLPIEFCSVYPKDDATNGGLSFSYRTTRAGSGSDPSNHGYTLTAGQDRKAWWLHRLVPFTDGVSSKCGFAVEKVNGVEDDIMIVYELSESVDIKRIDLDINSWKDVMDVYASSTRNTLFSSPAVAQFERASNNWVSGKGRNQDVDLSNIKYIGIHVKYIDGSGISEISVYSTAEPKATFYSGANKTGDKSEKAAANGFSLGTTESLSIEPGYKAIIYSGYDFSSEKWEFGRDVNSLSSIDVDSISMASIEYIGSWTEGDLDSDDTIDIIDLVKSEMLFNGDSINANVVAGDFNNTGRIDEADITALQMTILGVN